MMFLVFVKIQQIIDNDYGLQQQVMDCRPNNMAVVHFVNEYLADSIIEVEKMLANEYCLEIKAIKKEALRVFVRKVIKLADNAEIVRKFRIDLCQYANFRFTGLRPNMVQFMKIYATVLNCLQDFNNKDDMQFVAALETMSIQQVREYIRKNTRAGTFFKPLEQKSLREQLLQNGLKIKAVSSMYHSTLYSGTKKAFYTALDYMCSRFEKQFGLDMSSSRFTFNQCKDMFQQLIKVSESTQSAYYLRKYLVKMFNAVQENKKKPMKCMIKIYKIYLQYKWNFDGKPHRSPRPGQLCRSWRRVDDRRIYKLIRYDLTSKGIADIVRFDNQFDPKFCSKRILIRTKALVLKALRRLYARVDEQSRDSYAKEATFLLGQLVNGQMRNEIHQLLSITFRRKPTFESPQALVTLINKSISEEEERDRQKRERERIKKEDMEWRDQQRKEQDRYEKEGPRNPAPKDAAEDVTQAQPTAKIEPGSIKQQA